MIESEVTSFKENQLRQEEAAKSGLHGYAVVSRHSFIEARMQRGAERILHLLEQGKDEEAQALMATKTWGEEEIEEEERKQCRTTILA